MQIRHPTRIGLQIENENEADAYHRIFVQRYSVWAGAILDAVSCNYSRETLEEYIEKTIKTITHMPGEAVPSLLQASLFELDYDLYLRERNRL